MVKYISFLFFFIFSLTFSNLKKENLKPEYRVIGSFFTKHISGDDIYNNNTHLIGVEYRAKKDRSISMGYFKNSFNHNSYFIAVGKYFTPFHFVPKFYLNTGIGVVKGYNKINYIYDKNTGKVLKKSKFNTHIGGDYILGGSIGLNYDITNYLTVNISYVGAFIGMLSLKI